MYIKILCTLHSDFARPFYRDQSQPLVVSNAWACACVCARRNTRPYCKYRKNPAYTSGAFCTRQIARNIIPECCSDCY